MKRRYLLFLASVAIGVAAFTVCYFPATARTEVALATRGAELAWLREEFHLNDAQFTAIQRLYQNYAPRCEEMYRQITTADARADRLIALNHEVTAEVAAALSECAHIQEECRRAALAHIYAVAEQMPPAEATRYLALMKLRILEPGVVQRTASANWPH